MNLKKNLIIGGIAVLILAASAGSYFYLKSVTAGRIPSVDSPAAKIGIRTRKFPPFLAELPQVSHIEGEPAFAELQQLHGRRVPLVNAFILRYERDSRYIKLWISVSSAAEEASALEARMTATLSRTGMYTAAQPFLVGEKTVYGTVDTHVKTLNYYFASGPEVIWLETNLSSDEIFPYLPEVIRKY